MKVSDVQTAEVKEAKMRGIQKLKKRFNLQKFIKILSVVFSFTIVFVVASCAGMGPFGNNSQSSTQNQGIQTYQVVRGNILQGVTATGSVDAENQNTYSFNVSGKVISAPEKGAGFKKGDLLAELDNSAGLDTIKQLESSLLTAEDDISLSKSSLSTAKINYQKALDSNHIAVQLADLDTKKSQEAAASALLSLENANRSADMAYGSAISSLENTKDVANQSVKNAQSALDEAERILEAAEADPTTTPAELAQYEYNVKTAKQKLKQAKTEQESSISSAEDNIGSADIQNSDSLDSAQKSYNQAQNEQSSTYWSNLSNLETAAVQIKLTQQSINDTDLKLKQAERKVQTAKDDIETAKKDLEDYKIYALYDGIVLSCAYKAGEQASQGGSGISIINSVYIIRSSIGENDIPKIKIGDEAVISLDAYNNTELSGTVEKIIPVSSVSNGIVTYDVLLKFTDTKDVQIFYGFSANISIITARAENVLYVPIQSVYTENGKKFVDVMAAAQGAENNTKSKTSTGQSQGTGSQAQNTKTQTQGNGSQTKNSKTQTQNISKVEVTTGISDYVNIEIKSGIKEGDIIVTSKVNAGSATSN